MPHQALVPPTGEKLPETVTVSGPPSRDKANGSVKDKSINMGADVGLRTDL